MGYRDSEMFSVVEWPENIEAAKPFSKVAKITLPCGTIVP
jgi:hypothetical protein